MPIITPSADLPVNQRLLEAGVEVIPEEDAMHQDMRPLQIAILNLMPDKIETEFQLMKLIGATSQQIQLTLLRTATYESKNTSNAYLSEFYQTWENVKKNQYDGLVVTGAPVEERNFNNDEVEYWDELKTILDWARQEVYARLYICWGAQAALHHTHGIEKRMLPKKTSGIFPHFSTDPRHPLVRGFDDDFAVPISRKTEMARTDLSCLPDIDIVAESYMTGVYLMQSKDGRDTYTFNHPEYGHDTLNNEYRRDVERAERQTQTGEGAVKVEVPYSYYEFSDPGKKILPNTWRAHGELLYRNWTDMIYKAISLQNNKS